MSEQSTPTSTVPPISRSLGAAVREEELPNARARFIETFPPPPILMKPRVTLVSNASSVTYRVLVACDLSEFAEGVLREAIAYTHGHMPAELHLAAVVEKVKDHYVLNYDAKRRHLTREVVESLMSNLIWKVGIVRGSPLEDALEQIALHICVGDPAEEVLNLSHEIMADLIVIGSRQHQGLQRRVWGSISKTIVNQATCSVVLVRPVDFVHGHRTPSIEPPRTWTGDHHHLMTHHYSSAGRTTGSISARTIL